MNERIPVSKTELEAHWGIDCATLWSALTDQTLPCTASENQWDKTLRELELCTFVHQPPGELTSDNCPNYRGALEQVIAHPKDRCSALTSYVQQHSSCSSPP